MSAVPTARLRELEAKEMELWSSDVRTVHFENHARLIFTYRYDARTADYIKASLCLARSLDRLIDCSTMHDSYLPTLSDARITEEQWVRRSVVPSMVSRSASELGMSAREAVLSRSPRSSTGAFPYNP